MPIDKSQFESWRALLRGKKVPMHEGADNAISGYWRLPHSKGAVPDRVAIWRDENGTNCMWGDEFVHADRVHPYCLRWPISFEAYKHHEQHGVWADNHTDAPREPAPGDNNPPTDEAELLAEQIMSATVGVRDYATISDDDHLARSQTLRARLLELSRQMDTVRKNRKKPHQDKADEVDAKLMPEVKKAKAGADTINAAQNAYTTTQIRKREAAQAAIDAQAQELEAKGIRVAAFAPPPPLATKVKGAVGKAAHVGQVPAIKSVDDIDALFAHFRNEPDVKQCLVKLADIAIKAGQKVPGVTVEMIGKVK